MLPRLVIASKNPDKVSEVKEVLARLRMVDVVVEDLDWPDVVEDGDTLEANAALKAQSVAAATGVPALADDTGLEVLALEGKPGVKSARYAGAAATYRDNVRKLLDELEGESDRRALFRTVVALAYPGGRTIVADGTLAGEITEEPRGTGGFGYDPVFEVEGRTLAELTTTEKNDISHRRQALEALAGRLRSSSLALPDGRGPSRRVEPHEGST